MAAKRLAPLTISVLTAFAAWTTGGALTVTSAQPNASRLAVLPSPAWLIVWLVVVCAIILISWPSSHRVAVFALSSVLLLSWGWGPHPPALFIWTGHLAAWLWTALATAVCAPVCWRHAPATLTAWSTDSRRAPRVAGTLAAALYLFGAWQVSPRIPSGDEPHYLVITQSLLTDHDLKIENNHRRGDYKAYYAGDLAPDYRQRGKNGDIYSIHAPGLPVIVAPVFALFGYPGVVAFLAIVIGGATALAWTAVWGVTADAASSWFGWATVALSAPFFFQAFVAYPDALGAALVMGGVTTLMAGRDASIGRLLVTGLALAALPWLHTRFAIVAGALGAMILVRQLGAERGLRRAAALTIIPALSAVGWFAFFYIIYGTPDPRAPYGGYAQSAVSNVPRGLVGLLFDQQFGLLPNAPVSLCAIVGLRAMARRAPRLTIEVLLLVVPYGLAVAAYEMWWGGYSSAARFLVPVLLPLSIPAGAWFGQSRGAATRALGVAALFVSLLITGTIALVGNGALLYNVRDGASQLLIWLSPLVDLTTGLPSVFQHAFVPTVACALVWLGAIALTAAGGGWLARRGTSDAIVVVGLGFTGAIAAMLALSIVWRMNHAAPLKPTTGAIALLRQYDPDRRQMAVQYSPLQMISTTELLGRLRLADLRPPAARADDPLVVVPSAPAATYEIGATVAHAGAGRLSVALDRTFGPIWSWNLDGANGEWRRQFHLPVPVPAIVLDADGGGRQAIDRLSVRAVDVVGSLHRIANTEADHVVRYGRIIVFLTGGHAYAERAGTWVAGGASANFVVTTDDREPIHLFVRNPPIENHVTIVADDRRQELTMAPGEERLVEMPMSIDRTTLHLTVSSANGVRPTEFEPGSTDARLLGCWIETR